MLGDFATGAFALTLAFTLVFVGGTICFTDDGLIDTDGVVNST